MRVFITGITGLVGCHAAAAMLAAGHQVRALVRSRDKLERVMAPLGVDTAAIEVCEGDLLQAGELVTWLQGCDALVHCAGLFSNDVNDAEKVRHINVDGTRKILEAAVAAKLDPVIYVSSILALFPPPGDRQRAEDPVQTPDGFYAHTKADAESIAREHQARGAPVVTVYPGAVHGPHDPTFSIGPQMLADFLRQGKVLVTEGGLVYTDARDLARVITAALQPGQGARRFMFGGNFLSHAELHGLLCRLTGRELGQQRMPGWLMRLFGRIGDLGTRLFGLQPQLTLEKADVLTRSVPCDDGPAAQQLGVQSMSAEQSFRDLLVWMYRDGQLSAGDVGKLAED